ncbi:unnamed protein product [Sphagnum jensenii]|uniref:Uncharacterized protein n=1 Tax=Sphagnum jensenii TaxID=128206 RepID=A0ABP1ACZ9_9BRYO
MMELATTALSGDVPHGTNSSIVQVAGLQCILSGLGWTPGPPFSELLKPEIVVPLLENLQLKECLVTYLPEVLQSGQMDFLQFGITANNFTSFFEAIEEQAGADVSDIKKEQRPNQDVMKEGQ